MIYETKTVNEHNGPWNIHFATSEDNAFPRFLFSPLFRRAQSKVFTLDYLLENEVKLKSNCRKSNGKNTEIEATSTNASNLKRSNKLIFARVLINSKNRSRLWQRVQSRGNKKEGTKASHIIKVSSHSRARFIIYAFYLTTKGTY